jgi:hypothetical protein
MRAKLYRTCNSLQARYKAVSLSFRLCQLLYGHMHGSGDIMVQIDPGYALFAYLPLLVVQHHNSTSTKRLYQENRVYAAVKLLMGVSTL